MRSGAPGETKAATLLRGTALTQITMSGGTLCFAMGVAQVV